MSASVSWTDRDVLAARPPREIVSIDEPYAALVEDERTAAGTVEPVATLFLTNRECPFRCVYCDLWKHTTTDRVPVGAIPRQIDAALSRLPQARHIKLYNSGNFFDAQAIPPEDHPAIAERVRTYKTVIVENHPRLCGSACRDFRQRLSGEFEIAMGLESVHPDVLPRLNKRMTVDDFRRAAGELREVDIHVRTFLLLNPPWLEPDSWVEWALRGLETAIDAGSRVCTVIPVRAGNGAMELLAQRGEWFPPRLEMLEEVMETALGWNRARVFVDVWDAGRLFGEDGETRQRVERLAQANMTQVFERWMPLR
ncbi:MAG: radical SAM protein [Planctomycetaceae bacterium]|nr:radical SAM protein [Planctomycetaceae bacterium]